MFTDGDQIRFISPGDFSTPAGVSTLAEFWEEDGNMLEAYISPAGQYFQASDRSLKSNIKKIEGGLEKIIRLNGYTYDFIQSEEDIEKNTPLEQGVGVIAQELDEVMPELVNKTGQGHYLVNYDALVPVLIEAVKEQQTQIEALESQVERLERLEKELEEIKKLLKD